LDLVAYLRFASVYRAFDSLADFEAEITALRSFGDGTEPFGGARATPAPDAARDHHEAPDHDTATTHDPATTHDTAAPGDDLVGAGSGP
jgi:hypothetical protein